MINIICCIIIQKVQQLVQMICHPDDVDSRDWKEDEEMDSYDREEMITEILQVNTVKN